MRWLIIFVLSFVLMFAGGGITKAEDNVPNSIMDGFMNELQAEVVNEYVKGDARNLSGCDITFAIMSLTDGTAEAAFEADLAPGESVKFKLKPGDYAILVIYTKDGVFDGVVENAFRILDSPEPFGFNFHYGVPPVDA